MRYFEIISEAFNIDDYTVLGLDAAASVPFMKAGFTPKNTKAFLEYGISLEQAVAEKSSRLKREKQEAAERKMLDNIGELAKKNTPVTYDEACAIIADDEDLFDLVCGWTWNSDYAETDNPQGAAKFLSILKRIKPAIKKRLFRGQMSFSARDAHIRGFHSWSVNRDTAENFAERHGKVLEINRPIQGVSLEDIVRFRMRLRPGESHYPGPQGEWFVVDQPEQFER